MSIKNTVNLQRFKKLIDETGKTRQAIAEELHCDTSTVTKQYNGDMKISIDYLVKYAHYFGVSADYLLGLSDTPTSDMDLQFVSEYTGLTKEAANTLRRQTSIIPYEKPVDELTETELQSIGTLPKPQYHPEILSQILTSRNFYNMLCFIDEYIHCQEQREEHFKDLLKKHENGEKIMYGDLSTKTADRLDLHTFRSQKQYEKMFGELTREITERAEKSEEELLRLLLESFKNRIREAEEGD